jgi:hypothetical protein
MDYTGQYQTGFQALLRTARGLDLVSMVFPTTVRRHNHKSWIGTHAGRGSSFLADLTPCWWGPRPIHVRL